MSENPEGIPVFACHRNDYEEGMKPDGYATTRSRAAAIMRRVIAERDGDQDTGITGSNIYYSAALDAYFVEE